MPLLKKFLYSDIDGTLISNQHPVSPENVAAIARFTSAGGGFSVATGRSGALARPYVAGLPLTLPGITYNGAAVYDFATNTYLHKWQIPAESMRRVAETAMALYPTVCVEICDGRPMQFVNPNGIMDVYVAAEQQEYELATLESCGDCFKVLLYGEPQRLHEVEAALYAAGITGISTCFSAPYYLEVLPENSSKGHALEWICAYLGIERSEVAAIGDFGNDLTMLQFAALGAAPANAHPEILAAADVVVADCAQSAVAEFILKHLME